MIIRATRILCLLPILSGGAAAQFALPAEGPVPFRRDRLPLEIPLIGDLARQLEELAHTLPTEGPEGRRGRAQLLALSLALEPGGVAARRQLEELAAGKSPAPPHGDRAGPARERILRVLPWLLDKEAGPDAAALAGCLRDVLAITGPDHAGAPPSGDGQSPSWQGWIPPLTAYQPVPVPPDPPRNRPDPPAETGIKLASATITTALWKRNGEGDQTTWDMLALPLKMKARVVGGDDAGHPALEIGTGESRDRYRDATRNVTGVWKKLHGKWPAKLQIEISGDTLGDTRDTRKSQPVSAASLVLVNAALSGAAPVGGIIGILGNDGAFQAPEDLWKQLRAFEAKPGGRLVVPAAASPFLASFLAMEKPEFFLHNEVLAAEDTARLLDYSSSKPTAATAATLAKFEEIRSRAAGTDLRTYIGNSFVRRRLEAIVQEAPWHVSARMLLLQSTGNRPTSVSAPVLASELLDSLAPMKWLVADDFPDWDASYVSKLEPTYDACRAKLDPLEPYAAREDSALFQSTRELITDIRAVAKAGRSRAEEWTVIEDLHRARESLARDHKEHSARLRELARIHADEM